MKTKPATPNEPRKESPMKKTNTAATETLKAEPPAATLPDWATETPQCQTAYALIMDNWTSGSRDQDIELTRAEYIELKCHLAAMRGLHSVPAETPTDTGIRDVDDLLRVKVDAGPSPVAGESETRSQLSQLITTSIGDLSTSNVQAVARFADLCLHDRGCGTPAEEFITDLVRSHYEWGGLTPDKVMREFEGPDGFQTNYEECVEILERFNVAYTKKA